MATTSWFTPAVVTDGTGWADTANVRVSDNAYATDAIGAGATSGYLGARDMPNQLLSELPAGATIDGIEVRIEIRVTIPPGPGTLEIQQPTGIQLTKDQLAYHQHAFTTQALPGADDQYVTAGGATELWGTTWTRAEIIDDNFGVRFRVVETSGLGEETAFADDVQIRVHFTAAASRAKIIQDTGNIL